MYAGRHHSKPHGTSLAPRPGKPGMKLAQDPKTYPYAFIAHVGLKAADMMSSVDANAPPRLGAPFWSHG